MKSALGYPPSPKPNLTAKGYEMHVYCKYEHPVVGPSSFAEISGPNERHCKRIAKARGWLLHRDRTATCPYCSGRCTLPEPGE